MSRLSTRVLNPTPNGIDWIDRLYASHYLPSDGTWPLLFGPLGPRLFAPRTLPDPTVALAGQWDGSPELPDALIDAVRARNAPGRPAPRLDFSPPGRAYRAVGALRSYGLKFGQKPQAAAPRGAIYLNLTHYPLESRRHVAWLDARPDVRPVFFIHDLLPVTSPEAFWRGEPERHARRLDLLLRRGSGAIVPSESVAEELEAQARRNGRGDLPILPIHPPVAPLFGARCSADERLSGASYFVVCGTIEPRKNHALLADVWLQLVAELGRNAPKLVVVGNRGWNCADIALRLEDPALGGSVIQVTGLSNRAWRKLLAGASALLAPSRAEGFGLPLAEGRAAGVPLIASDLPVFREHAGPDVAYVGPDDTAGWRQAIMDATLGRLPRPKPAETNAAGYFAAIETFLANL